MKGKEKETIHKKQIVIVIFSPIFLLLLSLYGYLTYFRSECPFADEFGALGVDREGGVPLNGLCDRLNKNEGRFDKFA